MNFRLSFFGMIDQRSKAQRLLDALGEALHRLEAWRISESRISLRDSFEATCGGYGTVFRSVLDMGTDSQRLVAVKQLRPEGDLDTRTRHAMALARELAVYSQLKHPNVIPFLGFHLSGTFDEAWLVYPWMNLGNIADYLLREKPPLKKRLDLALDTAAGLSYLHTLKPPVCHGDLKALNVLVNDDTRAMLCDFGRSNALAGGFSGPTTSSSAQRGSLRYQSPEIVMNKKPYPLESDVWAWGCLLFEILTDLLPYHLVSDDSAVALQISQKVLPADLRSSDVPEGVTTLLRRCWQAEPKRRPKMKHVLVELQAQIPLAVSPTTVSGTECEGDGNTMSPKDPQRAFPDEQSRTLTPVPRRSAQEQGCVPSRLDRTSGALLSTPPPVRAPRPHRKPPTPQTVLRRPRYMVKRRVSSGLFFGEKFICVDCGASYGGEYGLVQHSRVKHAHECPGCDWRFAGIEELRQHMVQAKCGLPPAMPRTAA